MKELLLTLALANGGDLASTEYALSKPGLAEGNALLQHRPVRFVLKGGITAGEVWYLHELHKSRPKAAKWTAIALIAYNGAITAHNLRLARSR